MISLRLGTRPERRVRPATGSPASRAGIFVLTLLLVVAGALGAPAPAYAEIAGPPIALQLEALEPALPARDGTVTLRGTAINRSGQPITAAQAVLWRHSTPATDVPALRELTERPQDEVWGNQLWVDGAYQRLTTNDQTTWAPDEPRPFEVTAPVAALGVGRAGAYLLGVQIVGRINGESLATLGEARALVPLTDSGPVATDGTNTAVSAVLLSSRPSMIEPGLFLDDHLAAELAPEGRLTALLAAAERPEVSWLIDPALLDEITAMSEGYRVRAGDGEQPGAGQEAASRWLEGYARLDPNRGFRVPYAIPDVSMLDRAGLGSVVEAAMTASQRTPGVSALPLLGHVAGGALDPPAIALAEQARPAALLVSHAEADGGAALLEPIGTAPLLSFSPATTVNGVDSVVQARQQMLAESFLAAETEPGATTIRLLTSGEAAAADTAANAPWLHRRTLPELLTDTPAPWSGQLDYDTLARAAELDEARIGTVRETVHAYQSFIGMLAEPEAVTQVFDASIARSTSSWWRRDPDGFDRFAAPLSEAADRLWTGNAVELNAQRSVIMSGQSGSFPMTVTNHLDQPLRVTITFESFQPQRLNIDEMTEVVIPARQGLTVNVQPRAVGNGPVRISAQVTTPEGIPISKRVWLTVEATNFGRVGWIIVAASGIVLLATTVWRIRQVRHERQAALRAAPSGHDQPPMVMIEPPEQPPLTMKRRGGER
ncbi:MAG: DUF6049 family protein [Propionibacteriaceae bacterium]|nr:DUF6049 family protein [Propionibacteriaceae bacterium]